MAARHTALSNAGMADMVVSALLLMALGATAVLYAALISQRVHDRRLRSRMDQTLHVSAVARARLAERLQRA